MDEKKFKEHLVEKKVDEKLIEVFLEKLKDYQKYLKKQQQTIDTVDVNKLVDYTEELVKQDEKAVLPFLRGLITYAYFAKRNDFVEAAIDIFESFNAMDNLSARIAEWHGMVKTLEMKYLRD
ncbi:MAG: site-specific integrase [Candidatus Heimdallarchaeota archaeon]